MEIKSIQLYNNETKNSCVGICRRLIEADYEAVQRLERENQAYTASLDMCIDVEPWEVHRFLINGSAISYGVEVEGQLISLFAVIRPKAEENLGHHRSLSPEEQTHVAHWELTHVLHAYRGNSLQKTMGLMCFQDLLVEWPDVTDLFATIYPHNIPSLKSTFEHGFIVIGIDQKYGGHDRYILFRKVKDTVLYDPNPVVTSELGDYQQHGELFNRKLVGTALAEKDGAVQMVFCALRDQFR